MTVGLPPTVSDTLSAPLVAEFRRCHPAVRVVTSYTGYLLDGLFRGDIDAAILYDPRAMTALKAEPILPERLFVIGPIGSAITPERPMKFNALANMPLSRRHLEWRAHREF